MQASPLFSIALSDGSVVSDTTLLIIGILKLGSTS